MTFHWPPVWLSLRVAAVATAGALVLGLWLAYSLATREFPIRKAALALLGLLFATPVAVLAFLLSFLMREVRLKTATGAPDEELGASPVPALE